MKYAKDFKCSRCKKQAVVFVGLADPDATEYPMCRKCADDWWMDAMLALYDINFEKEKTDEKNK